MFTTTCFIVMNEGQIKIRIFLIRGADLLFLLAVLFLGLYFVLYSEFDILMGIATIIGLFLVNKSGHYSITKIVILRQELKKLQREHNR